jgi:hypothetical protein
LRDHLLNNGFVAFQKIEEDDEPFVMGADFYGQTFEDAVDALENLRVQAIFKDAKRPTRTQSGFNTERRTKSFEAAVCGNRQSERMMSTAAVSVIINKVVPWLAYRGRI